MRQQTNEPEKRLRSNKSSRSSNNNKLLETPPKKRAPARSSMEDKTNTDEGYAEQRTLAFQVIMNKAAREHVPERKLVRAVAQLSTADKDIRDTISKLKHSDLLRSRLLKQGSIEERRRISYREVPWTSRITKSVEEVSDMMTAIKDIDPDVKITVDASLVEGTREDIQKQYVMGKLEDTTRAQIYILLRYRIAIVYFPFGYSPKNRKSIFNVLRDVARSVSGNAASEKSGVLYTYKTQQKGTSHLFMLQDLEHDLELRSS